MATIQGLVVDLSAALKATMSADAAARQQAEQNLQQFRDSNFPSYLASLIAELNNDAREADVRQAAGLLLKNAVDAKEESRRADLAAKWVAVDAALKTSIRGILLQCLHSPVADVRKTTALVVSKIACIDLQQKEWGDLIQTLLANMGAQPPVSGTRQATLMTLGYICEEIDESLLAAEQINMILTAVVAGMNATEADESRLAAINALTNAINFAKNNFEVDNERNYLMQVRCGAMRRRAAHSDMLVWLLCPASSPRAHACGACTRLATCTTTAGQAGTVLRPPQPPPLQPAVPPATPQPPPRPRGLVPNPSTRRWCARARRRPTSSSAWPRSSACTRSPTTTTPSSSRT